MKSLTLMIIISGILSFQISYAQNPDTASKYIEAALLNCPLNHFSLDEFIVCKVSNKFLLDNSSAIFFLRGLAEPDRWCQLCHYQCMELSKLLKEAKYKSLKHEQFVFILPISKDSMKIWFESFPEQITTIKSWIKPKEANLSLQPDSWNSIAQLLFKEEYLAVDESIQKFHFLSDPNANYASTMGLRSFDWSGQKMLQNIPTILIIDSKGYIRFKYFSQIALDRPPLEPVLDYLINVR